MARQSIRPDARDYQVDLECRRRDSRGLVASKRVRAFSFLLQHSRRVMSRRGQLAQFH